MKELEALEGAMLGESRAETAARLWVTDGTIRLRRTTTLRKLGARNVTHAVALALKAGFLTLDTLDYPAHPPGASQGHLDALCAAEVYLEAAASIVRAVRTR